MVATAITALTAAAGIGMQLYGMNKADQAEKKQSEFRNEASKKQLQFAKQMSNLNLAIQAKKHQQDNLDYMRARRDIIRKAVVGGAEQTARAANSGSMYSSAYQGARATTLRDAGRQQLDLYQNKKIGDKIYDLQRKIFKTEARAGIVQSGFNQSIAGLETQISEGGQWAKFGQNLVGSSSTLGDVGETLFASPDVVIDPFSASDWANSTTYSNPMASSTTPATSFNSGIR